MRAAAPLAMLLSCLVASNATAATGSTCDVSRACLEIKQRRMLIKALCPNSAMFRYDVKSNGKPGCPSDFRLTYRSEDPASGELEVSRRPEYFTTCGAATITSLSTRCEDLKKASRASAGSGDGSAREPAKATAPAPAAPPDLRPVMSQECRSRLDAYGDAAKRKDQSAIASTYDAFRSQCQKDAEYLAQASNQKLPERAFQPRTLDMINTYMDPVKRMDALTNRSKDQPEYDLQKLITFGLRITAVAATAYRVSAPRAPSAAATPSLPAVNAPARRIEAKQPPTRAVPRSSGISGTP